MLGVLAVSVPGPFGPARLGVTVVSGPSMLPTYDPGDLVLTWRSDAYPVGTPIVYGIPAGEPGAGLNVVHRVVSLEPGGTHVTQGDNNDHVDPWRPSDADVKGRVVLRVPRGGIVLRWFGSPLLLALLSGLLAGASVFGWAGRRGGPPPPGGDAGVRRRHRRPTPRTKVALRVAAVGTALGAALTATGAQAAPVGTLASADLHAFTVPSSIAANPVSYEQVLTSETALEYCATVTVTNHSDQAVEWEITLNISQQPYNATSVSSSWNVTTVSFQPDVWRVKGVAFNSVLAAGASYIWGYCGARTPPDLADATAVATVTSSGGGQYCASVAVTTTSTDWIRWRVTIDHSTTGLTDNNYWLAAEPTNTSNATTISFDGGTGTWVVRGAGSNEYIRATSPATWSYCAPMSAASPLVDATVSATITSSGGGQYCADVTVSTLSATYIKWRATIDHTTPGLTNGVYWLTAQPTNFWNATSISFSSGTWVLKGTSSNELIRTGEPVTFGYCAPTNANADLVDATVSATVTSSGGGHYCADVTVSTTSTELIKWRATIDHATPGLTSPTYWLAAQPTNFWNATSDSFNATTGTWVLHGLSWNELIKAGQPQTFGFCT
jgi:signal peptidase